MACYLWQKYYVKCNYGKNIMANETEPDRWQSNPFCKNTLYRARTTKELLSPARGS